jgi:HEPN domain-containing protein
MSRGFRDSDSKRYFDWLFHANIDYLAAKSLKEDERCYNAAAFHCQQCIEKGLKGYLLFKKHRLYDGHNLTWLCKQAIQADGHFSQWLVKCTMLNRYYIETRYPADIPLDIDTETINELMQYTTEILGFISEQIRFDFMSYHKRKK